MTKETLLAHIQARIGCLHHHGGEPTADTGWLSNPGDPQGNNLIVFYDRVLQVP